MLTKTFTLVLASAALLAAPAASAQEGATKSVGVQYSDLDLSTEEGREKLDRRINRAAQQVCEANEVATGTRIPQREARECLRNAKQQLDRQIAQVIENQQRLGG